MLIIRPYYEIMTDISPYAMWELETIEQAARVCYKSESKYIDQAESARKLIKRLIERGHEAMLEHSTLMVKFVCDRGVSHELVRHRMASFAQESTRYCNYSQERFGEQITVIKPCYMDVDTDAYYMWKQAMEDAEKRYFDLMTEGLTAQEARCVLPMSLKTEVIITANYREWRHLLKLRCAPEAHPQMRELTVPLLYELQKKIPIIFDDIIAGEEEGGTKA